MSNSAEYPQVKPEPDGVQEMRSRSVLIAVLKKPPARVAAGLFAVLLVSDWLPWSHDVWQDHGMTTNVVSSLVFVLVTLWIIEDWLEELIGRRWKRARRAAHRALAEACLESRLRLTICVDGFDPRTRTIRPPLPDVDRIGTLLGDHNLARHPDVPVAQAGAYPQVDVDRWRQRFTSAIREPQWVDLLVDQTRTAKRALWDEISAWAPVMVSEPVSAEILNEVASLADAIQGAEQGLTDVRDGRQTDRATRATDLLLDAIERCPRVIDRLAPVAGWRGSQRRGIDPERDADTVPT